jgi:hypothetical protein
MKTKAIIFFSLVLSFIACKKDYQSPVPNEDWDVFNSSAPQQLANRTRQKMEGIYGIEQGRSRLR